MGNGLLLDRVWDLGARFPHATAASFVNEQGQVTESMSRADVVADIGEVAVFLRRRCALAPGDRVLLAYPPGLDFVRGLIGCLAAGVVPVPVYPPDPLNPQKTVDEFLRIAADCGAKAVLTDRTYAAARQLNEVAWPADPPWYVTPRASRFGGTRMSGFVPSVVSDWTPTADTVALLQYTSGSTGAPKGVILTHGNLAHQLDLLRDRLGMGLGSRSVAWVPPYHDLGLIGVILGAVAGGSELTMMSPLSFIQRPALWFELMDRVRATHTAGPNFGYELAVRKTTAEQRAGWDLSSLQMVLSGAEPVRADTTRRFLEAFSVSGLRPEAFCPSYGLAEHTVAVSLFGRSSVRVQQDLLATQRRAVRGEGSDSQVLLGCGVPTDDVDIRIVDPELCVPLAEGRVGEIWVDSPSKAAGYWGMAEQSRAIFQARLAGTDGDRGYLRTGDLGFIHDGELYVCGRIKDLLILGGRNIHPQDIEDALRDCHEAIRAGGIAAFSIDDSNAEALAVLVEVHADTSQQVLSSVVDAVRATVLRSHQLQCSVVVVGPPGSANKTTSGKLQRSRCRARLLDGSLQAQALLVEGYSEDRHSGAAPPAAPEKRRPSGRPVSTIPGSDTPSADELRSTVRSQLAAVLGIAVADIDVDQPLGGLGINSLGVAELSSRLSQELDTEVRAVDVINHPTVGDLATMLSRRGSHGRQPQEARGAAR
ncbi:AMP-binding protein [Mycobacterium spongiae]|uniref:AMP-binding protein n=1 Tax=Mycobacterium spongiae TaxID=886343 RepID=A0A975K561_9MYCO|nr:AMP-binding protein [Mycobacterium spongiae]